jgi:hypothetical protein
MNREEDKIMDIIKYIIAVLVSWFIAKYIYVKIFRNIWVFATRMNIILDDEKKLDDYVLYDDMLMGDIFCYDEDRFKVGGK